MAIRKSRINEKKDISKQNLKVKNIKFYYNPFTYSCQIDGLEKVKVSKLNGFLEKNKDTNIQIWIENFFHILEEEINDTSFNLEFIGRSEEFEDIEEEVYKLNNKGWNIELFANLVTSTNTNIFQELNDFVSEMKENAPTELLERLNEKKAFEDFERAKNSEAYVSVIATMSSGKSTLINAILEDELLPSKNEACTATICMIKDRDEMKNFRARVEDISGNEIYPWQENISNDFLTEVNEEGNKEGLNIFIEGDIPGINSQDMNLVMIDTPGPNNSQNEAHKAATYRYIKDNKENPLVLYVMNATQHATNDDNRLLTEIAEIIQKKGKQAEERFIFALNKIDGFDIEKESIEKLIDNSRQYLKSKGIKNPKIFPISAEFSKLKKLEIKGKKLTRTEGGNLQKYKYNFMPDPSEKYEGIDTIKYASISEKLKQKLYEEAKVDEEIGHLHYSGITAIEKYIDKYVSKYSKTQKIKDAVIILKSILDNNYNEYMLSRNKNQSELEILKKQIEDFENALKEKGEEQIKIIKAKIDKIQANKESFEKTSIKIEDTFTRLKHDFKDKECSETKAKVIVGQAVKDLDELLLQLKTDVESIVNDQLNEKAKDILDSLKNYFSEILDCSELNTELADTMKGLFDGELPKTNRLVSEGSYKKNVYKGQELSHTESISKWYNPFSWGKKKDIYVDVYEDELRINLEKVWNSEIRPLMTNFSKSVNESHDSLSAEIQSLKRISIEKVDVIEDNVKNRINELKNKIEIQMKLKEKNNEIDYNINKIVEYKKQLDTILSI